MSASTQNSDPDSSYDPPMQTYGLNKPPSIVIRPRKTMTRKGTSVKTAIGEAACVPSAFSEVKVLDKLVRPLKDIYLRQMKSGSQTVDGSQTGFMEKVRNAIGPRYDESNASRPNESVFVCYNGPQYRQVLKDNPHLVDWKRLKRGEVSNDVSETPTVSKPSVAEDEDAGEEDGFLGYYDSDPGHNKGDGSKYGGGTARQSVGTTNRGWDSD